MNGAALIAVQGAVSTTIASVKEAFEEIYWDSQIEQWVEYKGDEEGWTEEEKFYWSTLLTSIRESGSDARSTISAQFKGTSININSQQDFNAWYTSSFLDSQMTQAQFNAEFKEDIQAMQQQALDAQTQKGKAKRFLGYLKNAGLVKGVALSLGSLFLGAFSFAGVVGLQSLINMPLAAIDEYLGDKIQSYMMRFQAKKKLLSAQEMMKDSLTEDILFGVKRPQFTQKQLEKITENAAAIPNTQENVRSQKSSIRDDYREFLYLTSEGGIFTQDYGYDAIENPIKEGIKKEKENLEEIGHMKKMPELLETGRLEEITIDKEMTVSKFMEEWDLSPRTFGVLINGERVPLSYKIKPNEDRISVWPHLTGGAPMAETPDFNPTDANLKYPLNENDNPSTTLLKTILNIIHKFAPLIEHFYGVESLIWRGGIPNSRIAPLLGVVGVTIGRYIKYITETTFQQATYSAKDSYLKLRVDIRKNFKEKFHIEPVYSLMKSALDAYAIDTWGKVPWTLEIQELISLHSDILFTERKLSEKLGRSETYIGNLKDKGRVRLKQQRLLENEGDATSLRGETYTKFFEFLTALYKADPGDFKLHDIREWGKILEDCSEIVYTYMCDEGIIAGTDNTKELFGIIRDTLVALSHTDEFTFQEFTDVVSEGSKTILGDKLKYDRTLTVDQGRSIIFELGGNILYNAEGGILDLQRRIGRHTYKSISTSSGKRHPYWELLIDIQLIELMSVCLGLDVLREEFISDAVKLTTKYSLDLNRHHPDEDKEYYVLFDTDKSEALQIKLIPLIRETHGRISWKKAPNADPANVEAREKYFHLYQLMWIPYDAAKPDSYYEKLIRDEFDTRTYTFQGVEKKLWRNVDVFFKRYFKSWMMVKKEGIDVFFKSKKKDGNGNYIGYPNFYEGVVKPLRWQYIMYLEGNPYCEDPAFWYWVFNDYLRKNIYPIHFFPFKGGS